MTTRSVNLSTTEYVKANQDRKSALLQSFRDEVRLVMSDVKPALGNTVFHTLKGGDRPQQLYNMDGDIWALAMTDRSKLTITETDNIGRNDWYTEVAKGDVVGHELAIVEGENLDVDITQPENLWCAGGLMVYPTAGEQWQIVSDSDDDSVAGVGAQLVILEYLDTDYEPQTEIIALDGTTPVLTVALDCFRPMRLLVIQVGAEGANQGNIAMTDVATGNPRICLTATYNRSAHGFFTVPAGKTAYFIYGHSAIGKNKDSKIDIYTTHGDNGVLMKSAFADLFQNSVVFIPKAPVGGFIEKSDIQFRCTTLNVNTDASAFLQLMLVDNE